MSAGYRRGLETVMSGTSRFFASCLCLGMFSASVVADPRCADDNAGLTLPNGFCAWVYADTGSGPRHITVSEEGVLYANLGGLLNGKSILALVDRDGDGKADERGFFGEHPGNSIALLEGYLYASRNNQVVRYPIAAGALTPSGPAEVVVEGFPMQRGHGAKTFAIDPAKRELYINVGAPSNACQQEARTPGSPGLQPCPQRERQASVWRFRADKLNQQQLRDGVRFASGTRNLIAMAWNPATQALYAVQHGRDQLHDLWPQLFSQEQSAELPAEEFLHITAGSDFGWPYCYYDPFKKQRVLAPEYGGDGNKAGECARYTAPMYAFPAHYAPNGLVFYDTDQFPARYRNGAFVAFHGSWNRRPFEQKGFLVAFVPFRDGRPAGEWEIFANGFAGKQFISHPSVADHRPMSLAIAPDGTLYISDDKGGRIWGVRYVGDERSSARKEK